MATGRWWFVALWRSAPGTVALYGVIIVHGVLALWLLYDRRTLRVPAWEATQYTLGLVLPVSSSPKTSAATPASTSLPSPPTT
jgi:adenylate cyclase